MIPGFNWNLVQTEDENIFNDYFINTKRGHISRPLVHPLNEAKASIDSLINDHAKDDGWVRPYPPVIGDFVENFMPNACAASYKKKYLIGVNTGFFAAAWDLFLRMLSHEKILTTIGDCSKEKFPGPDAWGPEMVPKDETRLHYAAHLTNLALNYVFQHELGHILGGHIDYGMSKGLNLMDEASALIFNQDYLDNQTLEWHADSFSIGVQFQLLVALSKNPQSVSP
ncbi:MAG: hypothetical protein C0490_18175, partial [Marivirga sp.]|nr:hypothetical protein [Marivirga sp.]